MKSIQLVLISVIILMTTLACSIGVTNDISNEIITGNGKVKEKVVDVSGFNKVELNGIGDLIIEQGSKEGLRIKCEENFLPYIEVSVSDDTLVIDLKPHISFDPSNDITYYLSVKDLSSVELNGVGDIVINNLETSNLDVASNGVGDITITELLADNIGVALAGIGDIRLEGKVVSQSVSLSGTGDYKGKKLESQTAEVTISGMGTAGVRVSDSLKATISGTGSLNYIGDPQIEQNISGLGEINKVDE
ncbi:MAG: head GIN domain-containing protein [Anaerolineaceae bacterium]